MMYKAIDYEFIPKDEIVIKFGAFGTPFYILLRGTVSVRIPSVVNKDFTLRKLIQFLIANKRWMIMNMKYQVLLGVIQDFLHEIIKTNYAGDIALNFGLASQVLSGYVIHHIFSLWLIPLYV